MPDPDDDLDALLAELNRELIDAVRADDHTELGLAWLKMHLQLQPEIHLGPPPPTLRQ